MADTTITALTTAATIDAAQDWLPIDTTSLATTQKINRNTFLGITGAPLGTTDTQSVSNKTVGNTNTVTLKDTLFTLQDDSDTTKQAKFQLSGITTATTRTYTLPNASSTIADTSTAQTFTNKTLTAPAITGGSISNTTIAVDSIAEFTAANGVTIDGMNIKDGKLNTSNSVVTANYTDASITPSKLVSGTGSGWAWSTWTPTLTNFTIGTGGNAGTVATYIQIGKTVFFRIRSTLGTAGQSVGGAISFSLPVAPAAEYYNVITEGYLIGKVKFLDALTAVYHGDIQVTNATTAMLVVQNASSTYVQQTTTSGAIPFAWGVGDMWFGEGYYEAA